MVWTWPQRSAEVTWETRLGVRLSLGSSFGAQLLAKRLGLEGGPSALLKFPVFQIIKCCSSSPASALPPFSSLATAVLGRLQEAVQRDAQASEVSLGSQRHGRFVGRPAHVRSRRCIKALAPAAPHILPHRCGASPSSGHQQNHSPCLS